MRVLSAGPPQIPTLTAPPRRAAHAEQPPHTRNRVHRPKISPIFRRMNDLTPISPAASALHRTPPAALAATFALFLVQKVKLDLFGP